MFTRASFSDHKSAPESFRYQIFPSRFTTLLSRFNKLQHTRCSWFFCPSLTCLFLNPVYLWSQRTGRERPRGDWEIPPRSWSFILPSSILLELLKKKKVGLPLGLERCRNEHIMIKRLWGFSTELSSCAAIRAEKVWEMASLAACVYSKLRWDCWSNHCYSCNNDIS